MQLLLTCAHGVMEWANFIEETEDAIGNGWIQDNLGQGLVESYRRVRDCDGDYRNVTHWTEGNIDCEERASRLESALEPLLGSNLGNGHFSSVFECSWDDTKCIKIGGGGNFDGDIWSDGWLAYAAYCMKQYKEGNRNPLLPRIHELYISEDSGFFLALLDRYDSTWAYAWPSDEERAKFNGVHLGIKGRVYNTSWDVDEGYKQHALDLKCDSDFMRVDDLHNNNIMLHEGNIIITDPSGINGLPWRTVQYRLRRLGIIEPDTVEDERYETQLENERIVEKHGKVRDAKGFSWGVIRLPSDMGIIAVDAQGVAKRISPFSEEDNKLLEELQNAA